MFTAGELRAFGFTEELVDRIMRYLDSSAEELALSKPDSTARAVFGSAPASVSCSGHAAKARLHVVQAITDMVDGLHGYRTSIGTMKREADIAEDVAIADFQRLLVRSEACASAPTVGSPSQCVPLEESGS